MADGKGAEGDEFDSPDWLVRESIRRAKDGDTDEALDLMHTAMCGLLVRSINPYVSDYLADCLMAAHKALSDKSGRPGEVLVKAFNLTKGRHRPNAAETQKKNSNIAFWVRVAQDECGMSAAAAKDAAGELFGVENINRALRDAGEIHHYSSPRLREYFLSIGKPLPPKR